MSSTAKFPPWLTPVAITALVAIACELGFWLLSIRGQPVSMIWPAAGVSTAVLYHFGPRAFPWVALGHVVLWLRFGWNLSTAFAPLVLALEARLAWQLAFGLPRKWRRDSSSVNLAVWQMLPVPWLAALPCAAILAALGVWSGRFPRDEYLSTTMGIVVAHAHGLVVFTPAFAHLLKRDFQLMSRDDNPLGFVALIASFTVMFLAFTGFFREALGMSSAAYLAFPFLMVAAVSVRPPVIAVALVVWCVGTTVLTSLGHGPFATPDHKNPLELGIYNLVICYTTYLISAGSTMLIHQLRRDELIRQAAGVELWEWDSRSGLQTTDPRDEQSRAALQVEGLEPAGALLRLSGDIASELDGIPERWKQRLEIYGSSSLLMSAGHVLSRARDGAPKEAIGMLQDLTSLRRAEEALIELGQKQAVLEGLQTRLNPHFLFNALNAIRALIHIDTDQASNAVTVLAKLLRANLRNLDRPVIPLDHELDSIHHLLEISKVRFGSRLTTRIQIDRDAMDMMVPPMIVFNLVENALIHGVEKFSGEAEISLTGELTDGKLIIRLTNPGTLDQDRQSGIGTNDLLRRLNLIYGGDASFELTQMEENLVSAVLILPSHESPYRR